MTLAEAIDFIHTAPDRSYAAAIRDRVIHEARRGERPKADWDAVCQAVIARWGAASVGGYSQDGFAHTGD